MMNIVRRFRKRQDKPVKIVFLGLDQAGKSTILAWLKGKGFTAPRRTLGMDVADGNEIYGKKLPWVNPANMVSLDVDIPAEVLEKGHDLEVYLDG